MTTSLLSIYSCKDATNEPFYTFTGEMLTDYLENRQEKYSGFVQILKRAEIYDLLSTYGTYTCFAPTNSAINTYLHERGLKAISELSDSICDTIAYNHLIKYAYFTSDLNDGVIPTSNMNDRYLTITCDTDSYSNVRYFINKKSQLIIRDDSVENGVVHTINRVLSTNNDLLPELMEKDSTISLFYSAFIKTGLDKVLHNFIDETYSCGDDSVENGIVYFTAAEWETAYFPKQRKFMYTVFAEPNSVFKNHTPSITTLTELIAFAKKTYDETYPEDRGLYDYDFTHRKNPLNRFVAYHILDRLANYYDLTVSGDYKKHMLATNVLDATDYYETLCPYTILQASSPQEGMFLNRKGVGYRYSVRGVRVSEPTQSNVDQSAWNGVYHYIDDVLTYNIETIVKVLNCRIRIDATTLSPDFMTSGARGRPGTASCSSFKTGFIKNWNISDNTFITIRNRHLDFDCYQGDEIVLIGQFDFNFKLPPVPEGTYEIRLGYCAFASRGVVQLYFDNKPCGIPLDLRLFATNPVVGWVPDVTGADAAEKNKATDKALHNRGYMKGPDSMRRYWGGNYSIFRNQPQTFRRILTTQYLSSNEDHYIRVRQILENNKADFDLDYIELCPKSIYASEEGEDTH